MKEEYVSYSQAVALKGCGFDWECYTFWSKKFCTDGTPTKIRRTKTDPKVCVMSECNSMLDEIDSDLITAPTLALVQKWLREVKKIDVLVWVCACGYGWNISKAGDEQTRGTTLLEYDDKGEDEDSGMWLSYEAALSAGLDAALELIKQK